MTTEPTKQKLTLESDLRNLIAVFEQATGLEVTEIRIDRARVSGYMPPNISARIEVKRS